VFKQSQGQEWGRGGGGVLGMRGGGDMRGRFLNLSWEGGEEGEETVHMPVSVRYVTEEQVVFVKGAFKQGILWLGTGYPLRGDMGLTGDGMGAGGLRLGA